MRGDAETEGRQQHPLHPVREALVLARQDDVDFADAWLAALQLVDATGRERCTWLKALAETLQGWEAAYYRRPADSFASAAVTLAAPIHDHHDVVHDRAAA